MKQVTLIDLLLNFIDDLNVKPFFLFSQEKQNFYFDNLDKFISSAENYLNTKNLQTTILSNAINDFKNALADHKITEQEELVILQAVLKITDFYYKIEDPKLKEKVDELSQRTSGLYHIYNELQLYWQMAENKRKELNKGKIRELDLAVMSNEGLFYIIEYHLQMYYELTHCVDEQKLKELIEAPEVKLEAGVLMGLKREMESREFLNRLAYKIIDKSLHSELIRIYYRFKENLDNFKNFNSLLASYKHFIIQLLLAFGKSGIDRIIGKIYFPYGENTKIEEVINKL